MVLVVQALRLRPLGAVRDEPPGDQADGRQVVGAPGTVRADPPDVRRFRGGGERGAEVRQGTRIPERHRAAGPQKRPPNGLGSRHSPGVFDRPARPPGRVRGVPFDGRQGALGASVADSVGDLAAPDRGVHGVESAGGRGGDARTEGDLHPVGEVGHQPVLARLDEPVVVHPGDVRLEHRDLVADHSEQGLQRPVHLGVAELVESGQEGVEPVVGHQVISCCRTRVSGMASDRKATAAAAGARRPSPRPAARGSRRLAVAGAPPSRPGSRWPSRSTGSA